MCSLIICFHFIPLHHLTIIARVIEILLCFLCPFLPFRISSCLREWIFQMSYVLVNLMIECNIFIIHFLYPSRPFSLRYKIMFLMSISTRIHEYVITSILIQIVYVLKHFPKIFPMCSKSIQSKKCIGRFGRHTQTTILVVQILHGLNSRNNG